jgi:hypothetical protein
VVLSVAAILAALTTVAWRQSSARGTMKALTDLERQIELARDEQEVLSRDLMVKEGRNWILAEAERRLGLRPPREAELQFIPGVGP